jgi:hypothetical protein
VLGFGNGAAARSDPPSPRPSRSGANLKQLIGNDPRSIGQDLKIAGRGTLQVDGEQLTAGLPSR